MLTDSVFLWCCVAVISSTFSPLIEHFKMRETVSLSVPPLFDKDSCSLNNPWVSYWPLRHHERQENSLPLQIGWVKYTPPGAALLFPELSVYYFLCYYISNCALIAWHKLHCTIAITTFSAGKAFSTLFFGDPICLWYWFPPLRPSTVSTAPPSRHSPR